MLFIVILPCCLLLDEQLKAFLQMFLKQTTHVQEMWLRWSRCRWDGAGMLRQVWFQAALMVYVGHRSGCTLPTFGPFHTAIFWALHHSAIVGICKSIALAGFYFIVLSSIINHPSLHSLVSKYVTCKTFLPPSGQTLSTRGVEFQSWTDAMQPGFLSSQGRKSAFIKARKNLDGSVVYLVAQKSLLDSCLVLDLDKPAWYNTKSKWDTNTSTLRNIFIVITQITLYIILHSYRAQYFKSWTSLFWRLNKR